MSRVIGLCLVAVVLLGVVGLAAPSAAALLQPAELAALVGGNAASELACGFVAGVAVGSGIASFFGCGPCAIVALGASIVGLACV